MTEAFDWQKAVAEIVQSQVVTSGPYLSFSNKCAAFAALKAGVRHALVEKAFGISSATCSYLNTCDQVGAKRYQKVAREFARMGDRRFMEHYYTDDVHTRIQRIKHEVPEPSDIRTRGGPNPLARSKAFPGTFECAGEHWRIDWCERTTRLPGWYFSHCQPNGAAVDDAYFHRGQEALDSSGAMEQTPFRTSQLAYDAVFKMTGED